MWEGDGDSSGEGSGDVMVCGLCPLLLTVEIGPIGRELMLLEHHL